MRPAGLLFRALREEEVERSVGRAPALAEGALRPKARGSGMSVLAAVEEGSRRHESPYVHTTTDVLAAVYFATSLARGKATSRVGTPSYIAPEVLQHDVSPGLPPAAPTLARCSASAH